MNETFSLLVSICTELIMASCRVQRGHGKKKYVMYAVRTTKKLFLIKAAAAFKPGSTTSCCQSLRKLQVKPQKNKKEHFKKVKL